MKKISNPPIVFLPGFGFKASVWTLIANSLQKDPVILVDLPSVSESDDFDAVTQKISEEIPEGSVIIGWSLGGLFAINICKLYPEKCSRLVLLSSLPKFKSDEKWRGISIDFLQNFELSLNVHFEKLIKKFIQYVKFPRVDHTAKLNEHLDYDQKKWIYYFNFLINLDLRLALSVLTVPITAVFGEKDAIVPVIAAQQLKEINSAIEVKIIPNVGHDLFVVSDSLSHDTSSPIKAFEGDGLVGDIQKKIRNCFDKAALTYDEKSIPQQAIGLNLINLVKPYCAEFYNIIDLGCGTGWLTHHLVSLASHQNFYALDLSPRFILQAKARLENHNVHFINDDFDHFNIDKISFDLVFSNMSLQWSIDLSSTLSNIHRQLSKNGILAFSVPISGNFPELKDSSKNKFFSEIEISDLLLQNGFDIIHSSSNFLTYYFDTWIKAFKSIKETGANYLFKRHQKSSTLLSYKKTKDSSVKPSLTYKIGYFIARKK